MAQSSDVRVDVAVEAPIETTFRVFTEQVRAWWPDDYVGQSPPTEIVLQPHVGGRVFERAADGTECPWGEVLDWDPPNRVAFSWAIAPAWQPEPDPERASRVDVRFTAVGAERTDVILVHSGFERHGEGWEAMRASVAGDGGWRGILTAFAKVAARA